MGGEKINVAIFVKINMSRAVCGLIIRLFKAHASIYKSVRAIAKKFVVLIKAAA